MAVNKSKKLNKLTKQMRKKLVVVFLVIAMLLIGLMMRLMYIQTTSGKNYEKIVLNQQSYGSEVIPYQRGDIVDSKGTVLATSVDVYNVILDCKLMNEDDKVIKPTIAALTSCFLDVTEEEIRGLLTEKAQSQYCVLRKKLSYDQIELFVEMQNDTEKYPNIKGVWFEKEYIRNYPYDSLACKPLGFTTSGNVGIGGLEDYYNDTLNGVDGRQFGYLSAENNLEKSIKNATNGDSLVTTLDINVQKVVEEKIAAFNEEHKNEESEGAGSENTAVLIMNPNNGEILAMADSNPYNLNNPRDLTPYFTAAEIDAKGEKEILEDLNSIWENFCITYTFEPGSTVKPFTVAAGLETGKLSGNEVYTCDGYEMVGGHKINCVNTTGHGTETIEQAIMNSCNDALMQMAEVIGTETFTTYQNIFNFGLKTNIDLPGEARTDSLIYQAKNMASTDLATNSFGQNFNVTMVQVASAFASIINGGSYYQPHLVKKIVDQNGNTVKDMEPVLLKQTISKQTGEILKKQLQSTVTAGTAKGAKVEGYSMGGKTGTAQTFPRGNGKYLVSYIGFAPMENPQVLIYVVINQPNVLNQAQSALATNLAKEIMTDILPYLYVFPDEAITEDGGQQEGGTKSPAADAENEG